MEGENKETLPLSRHSVIFREDTADTICMFLKKVGLLKVENRYTYSNYNGGIFLLAKTDAFLLQFCTGCSMIRKFL